MPDWITHVLVAWTICTVLSFKSKQFNPANTAICMVGALIPDVYKIVIPLEYLGVYAWNFILPFHMPVGSFIIATIFSLFFKEQKTVLLFLLLGVLTHYMLDLLLTNLSEGIYLLYPFSWSSWQFDVIPVDDLKITVISIALAVVVYFVSFWRKRIILSNKT
ncbi:MAG: metal-dependent hydrolase [Methanobacterium sp.]|jgi:hypothetical protein